MLARKLFMLSLVLLASATSPAWGGNNSGAAFSTWPDTNVTQCYDAAGTVITCPAAGQPFHGQDAQYQEAGRARSYTKLDSNGTDLPAAAVNWAMVRDNVTGLIWEEKQNKDGTPDYTNPHDADNTYTWCDTNPDTNGGNQGTCGTNDTEDFITALNSENSGAGFGGYTDWRLPTLKELVTLVDYSRYTPAIDPVFPGTVSSNYWSSTTYASNTSNAWRVNFLYGNDYYVLKSSSYYVRAVRGGQ